MKITVKDIAYNGIIAALYVILTLLTYPFSFLGIQFRFAEILLLLVFFRKDYTIGLCAGCALANLFSSIGIIDVAFGTLATLLSCLVLCFCKQLFIGALAPVLFNGAIIGLELYFFVSSETSFWFYALTVAIGELVVMAVGYVLFMFLRNNQRFMKMIRAKQNLDFKL